MTHEDAIKVLTDMKVPPGSKREEAVCIAIKLLWKAEPMRVRLKRTLKYIVPHCERCDRDLELWWKYCPLCGQAIDWGKM